ncbi:lysozyme inhibitor LprI family protein [Lishizhenia tianjinensis]|nr:lysozyme inhibitor LprI family protein [Lishizhenia tianjinensis]
MQYANKIDCDSTSGSNLEHRICLNLEFQELDSLMNNNFRELLQRTENDSIKSKLSDYQLTWVNNRRLQSELISGGYTGHM